MRYLVAVIIFVSFLVCAEEREGKVFIKTEPSGAEISLTIGEGENQKFETLGKTPMLAKVPIGKIKLILQMKEFKSAVLELEVKDTTIQKPEAVKLVPILYNIDVLYKEEGWAIWVDGKDIGKKTPDTIELQAGEHKIVLKKDGFKDIGKDVKVGDVKNVEFTEEAIKINSVKIIEKKENRDIEVIALIDGKTELHVTPNGLYWKVISGSKPGRHNNKNEPTYINGLKWMPKWKEDSSDIYIIAFGQINKLNFELLMVGDNYDSKGIQERDQIEIYTSDNEYVLIIPDSQNGSKWYKLRLFPRK